MDSNVNTCEDKRIYPSDKGAVICQSLHADYISEIFKAKVVLMSYLDTDITVEQQQQYRVEIERLIKIIADNELKIMAMKTHISF